MLQLKAEFFPQFWWDNWNLLFASSENNTVSVWNNGKGIPVVEHKVEKVYVPALIFGQLLTSSNYDDDQKKVTGEFCSC